MTIAKGLTRQSLSTFLGLKAERSRRCGSTTTQGFVIRENPDLSGGFIVEYEPGTRAVQHSTPERLLKVKQSTLGEYRERLVRRYQVAVNSQGDPRAWDGLLVQESEEDEA